MPDPDERTWHCRLCPDVITGRAYAALMDHFRLMHPDMECHVRRPDGQVRLTDATGGNHHG